MKNLKTVWVKNVEFMNKMFTKIWPKTELDMSRNYLIADIVNSHLWNNTHLKHMELICIVYNVVVTY